MLFAIAFFVHLIFFYDLILFVVVICIFIFSTVHNKGFICFLCSNSSCIILHKHAIFRTFKLYSVVFIILNDLWQGLCYLIFFNNEVCCKSHHFSVLPKYCFKLVRFTIFFAYFFYLTIFTFHLLH